MKTKIIYFLFIAFIIYGYNAKAQDTLVLNNTIGSSTQVAARTAIILKPGFKTTAGITFRAYIDPNLPLTTNIINATYTAPVLSAAENYIFTRAFLVPTTSGMVDSANHVIESVQYFDGLGRLKQVTSLHASSGGKSIIQHVQYDPFGREAEKYLPFEIQTANNGQYVPDARQLTLNYYNPAQTVDYATDLNPYAVTKFENSPLNRIVEQGNVGTDWQPGTGHTVKTEYFTNTGEIIYWQVDNNDNYMDRYAYSRKPYLPNTLNITQVTAEDGQMMREYKNLLGQVVLTETFQSTGNWLQTYYVYDHFGLLRCVVSPNWDSHPPVQPNIPSTAFAFLDTSYCYFYKYDERKRLTNKKLPGASEIIMIYDNRDRLVLSQDGNQRGKNLWSYIKYDALNRPVITGTGVHPSSEAGLRTLAQTVVNYNLTGKITDTGNHGYTPSGSDIAFTTNTVHTVTYYDNYNSITGIATLPATYAPPAGTNYSETQSLKVKGLVTATKTRNNISPEITNSGVTDYSIAINYYDKYGRLIQTYTQNHTGGTDIISTDLDFTGRTLALHQQHTAYTGVVQKNRNHYYPKQLFDKRSFAQNLANRKRK